MRLPNVLNQLNEAVFIIDPGTDNIVDVNPKACEMLGYSREELISVGVSAIHPDEIQEFNTFAQAVQTEGRGWTDELRCLTKPGKVVVAEISASMVVIDGISCMVAIVRPVFETRLYTRHIEAQRNLAIMEERGRLSREIHDTIAQSLSLLVLRLELVGNTLVTAPTAAKTELESINLLIKRSMEEVRRSIWDLQPQTLDSLSLVDAVNIEMEKLQDSSIAGDVRVSGAEVAAMDPRHRSASLRVVQESLSNVIKHSDAKIAVVHLDFGMESLSITIADDGIGFEPWNTRSKSLVGGFGIASMQERAYYTGGWVNVHSALGQGTTVEVQIPYRPPSPEMATPRPSQV